LSRPLSWCAGAPPWDVSRIAVAVCILAIAGNTHDHRAISASYSAGHRLRRMLFPFVEPVAPVQRSFARHARSSSIVPLRIHDPPRVSESDDRIRNPRTVPAAMDEKERQDFTISVVDSDQHRQDDLRISSWIRKLRRMPPGSLQAVEQLPRITSHRQ